MPDGTVIKNVPEGTSQSDLLRRYEASKQLAVDPVVRDIGNRQPTPQEQQYLAARQRMAGQSIGPAELSGPEISRSAAQEVSQQAQAIDKELPWIERYSTQRASVPIIGGMAGAMVPGAGWGALALSAGLSGAGAGGGELLAQKRFREPTDVGKAVKRGAVDATATLATGAALKGLGAVAKKLFSSPLSDPQQAAATFAKQEKVPFPLSSAAPGSGAARTQNMAGGLLPGAIKNQADAKSVAVYLNNTVGTMTEKASVFDDAAKQGQTFLRSVFEPGETAYKQVFSEFTEAAGDQSAIPIANMKRAALEAANRLQARGQTTGGLYQRLRTIIKTDAPTMTPAELDELYGAIIKQAFNSRGAAGGEGKIVLSGIVQDMDAFVPGTGNAVASAEAVRESFRELRNIPALQRLAAEMKSQSGAKGTIDWMNTLFQSGNGKALSKLRELNPQLYHDLADAYLAREIDIASKYSVGGFARQIDGQKLRSWFTANQPRIKEIYGSAQAQVLDNFTNYAQMMSGAQKAAEEASKGGVGMNLTTFGRGLAEGGAMLKNPVVMVPTEASAFVLARGLSDPSSQLFKVFTKGFSPSTKFTTLQLGEAAGRETARRKNEQDAR